MPNSGDMRQFPATLCSSSRPPGTGMENGGGGLDLPLLNLSGVLSRMDHVQRFLSDSIRKDAVIGEDQMRLVSSEISSAIHQVIVNGAAILSFAANAPDFTPRYGVNPSITPVVPGNERSSSESDLNLLISKDEKKLGFVSSNDLKVESVDEEIGGDWDIVELDAVELLAEHLHFCEICGKGFKRDANLRMHMRAHGNQFKTPEALAKPEKSSPEGARKLTRFSCPFIGCNRNKMHKKFRPLKSVICVKNHFKRSHCPKMFSCNRCNKKSFSVVADLKSHLKHCGETKWKCSCGTSFSRKDKLFGHMALFEGHMPAVMQEEDVKEKEEEAVVVVNDEEEDEEKAVKEMDNGLFEGMLDELGSVDDFCFQDVFDSPDAGLGGGMDLDWLL